MSTIDSFVVEWILNPDKYVAGQKKLAEANKKTREDVGKTTDDIGQAGKRSAEFFGKLRTEAVGLFLAFQGASSVKSFIGDLLSGDAATGRLAKNLNTTTNELSAWQIKAKEAGGSAQDANVAFGVMAQLLQNFRNTGLTGQESNLRALGLAPKDLETPTAALMKLAEARERFVKAEGEQQGGAHFYGLAKALGIPDAVINSMTQGRAELTRQIDELRRHAAATDEDAKKAAELDKQWADIQAHFAGSVRPELYRLVTTALDLVDAISQGVTEVPELTAVLGPLIIAALAVESPFIAAGVAIVALLGYLGDLEKAYAHTVFATHGWIGGFALYNQMVGAGVKSNADIDRIIDADRAKNGGGSSSAGGGINGNSSVADIRAAGFPGYQGRGGGGGGKPASKGSVAAVDDVYRYFLGQGYSDAAARGIAAGVFAESGGQHQRFNEQGSGAYGLAQWLTKGRLKHFEQTYGHSIYKSSRAEQLAFIAKELSSTEGGAGRNIRGARTAAEAARAFVYGYERPGAAGGASDMRSASSYLAATGNRGAGGGVTINGGVTVNTRATDADGIAKDFIPAVRRRASTTQANRGLD